MAKSTIMVALDLSDAARDEEIAAVLAEERGIAVGHADGFEASDMVDVIVTDGTPADAHTPHILIVSEGVAAGGHGAANVFGLMPETASPEMIAAAIRLVAEGYRLVAPASIDAGNGARSERFHLSAREHEVLALLSEGAPNKVIARRLDISVHTAKFHVAAIVSKLHATNRTDAIAIAMREGLVLL